MNKLNLCLSLALSGAAVANAQTEKSKPNIVIIYADDMGVGDVSKNDPEAKIQTPNLDRLASQGVTFTDGHSTAQICTPSRYSLLTGRYYWRNETYKKLGWKVVIPGLKPIIEKDRLTFPAMLQESGYHTACVGKWHLGFDWASKEGKVIKKDYKNVDYTKPVAGGPITKGFNYFYGFDSPNSSYCFIENDRHVEIPSEKPTHPYAKTRIDLMQKGWSFEGMLPKLEEKSIAYIKERSAEKAPFFLYIPLNGPHTPIAPSKEFVGKSKAGPYGDFIVQIDSVVGNIVKALKEQGLEKNTIVIFTSDNGSPARDGSNYIGKIGSLERKYGHVANGKYRGLKADLWEAGHRVPFIVKWPGLCKAGTTSDQLISQVDLMRTMAGYLDVTLPENAAEDSYDVLPLLKGEQKIVRDNHIVYAGKVAMVRRGKWKLILHKGGSGFSKHAGYRPKPNDPEAQLYDMENDPYEKVNLYEKHPEIVKQLKAYLKKATDEGRTWPSK